MLETLYELFWSSGTSESDTDSDECERCKFCYCY